MSDSLELNALIAIHKKIKKIDKPILKPKSQNLISHFIKFLNIIKSILKSSPMLSSSCNKWSTSDAL